MMHFNRTDTSMWTSIVFICPFHDICYLSFRLKLEGMNFVVDNFNLSTIIEGTNKIITKMNNQETFTKRISDGECVYLSPVQICIDKAYESNPSPWQKFQGFQVPRFIHHYIFILIKIMACTQLIFDVIFYWIISKDKGKKI